MNIGNLILGANSVTVSCLIRYDSFLRQILLQNAAGISLQNATEFYYKMHQIFYYKMQQFYYKVQHLLHNATILLQNAAVITKYDVHYKSRQYSEEYI